MGYVQVIKAITAANSKTAQQAQTLHLNLTKPPGSLGQLEQIGIQLSAIAQKCPPPLPSPATVVIFAADHGVISEGVSPWPSEVTAQMVENFCHGGAAINVIARQVGAKVEVVDIGVARPIKPQEGLISEKVSFGTKNLAIEPAMDPLEVIQAIDVGIKVSNLAIDKGSRCLIGGDMGIANTTSSAAIISYLTNSDPIDTTGRGTGISDELWQKKVTIVQKALDRLPQKIDTLEVLGELGGLETAGLVGFFLQAAARKVPIILDGVNTIAAALVAQKLCPPVVDYFIAGHRSSEPGATIGLSQLGLEPLLNLGMRLGEGSGGCLALPLVQLSSRILNEMATFDSAGVSSI